MRDIISVKRVDMKATRDDALILYLLTTQYERGLRQDELELAMPRLKIQFQHLENWLNGKGLFFSDI